MNDLDARHLLTQRQGELHRHPYALAVTIDYGHHLFTVTCHEGLTRIQGILTPSEMASYQWRRIMESRLGLPAY
jgi:hypothetical protein